MSSQHSQSAANAVAGNDRFPLLRSLVPVIVGLSAVLVVLASANVAVWLGLSLPAVVGVVAALSFVVYSSRRWGGTSGQEDGAGNA